MKDLSDKLHALAGPGPNGPQLRLRLLLPLVLGLGTLLSVFIFSVRQDQQKNDQGFCEEHTHGWLENHYTTTGPPGTS